MSTTLEWITAGKTVVTPRIQGEISSDGQEIDHGQLAVEVTGAYSGDGAILAGSREDLLELGARIIEAAIQAHIRHESGKLLKTDALARVIEGARNWRDELTTYIVPSDESMGLDLEETASGHRQEAADLDAALEALNTL